MPYNQTSKITYPSGGEADTVTVSVGKHADVADLEPTFISIEASAFKRDGQFAFHKQEDFEEFLSNLIDAANEAYEQPDCSNNNTVVINLELDSFDFDAELARVKDALAELVEEAANAGKRDDRDTEFLNGADDADESREGVLAPELTPEQWNRALECVVRTEHEVIEQQDKTGTEWRRVYADEKSSEALLALAKTLTQNY